MMILAYYFFIGLLSSTNGQALPDLTLSNAYVDRFKPVVLTCTTGLIYDSVDIYRNGTSIYRCSLPFFPLFPLFPCDNLLNIAEYSVVQDRAAGTTIMTISASNISRDTGSWACQHGAGPVSQAVSLTVGTPLKMTSMTELAEAVVIQTSCTFPAVIVNVTCSLDGASLVFTYSVTTNGSTCTDPNEAALTVTISVKPIQSVTGPGFLYVSVFNGIHRDFRTGIRLYTFSRTTTATTHVTSASSSSTSKSNPTTTRSTSHAMNSSTSISVNPATSGPTASASISISISTNSATTGSIASASSKTSTSANHATTGSTANATNNISTVTSSTANNSSTNNKSMISGVDIKVIVPAVVVPGGLVVIGAIIVVVVCIKHHRAGKNVSESPDGLAVQDKGSNVDGWKQSLGHGRVADKLDAVYTTHDGFIINPGPLAMSAARQKKEKKYPDVAYQYETPYTGTYGYQTAYVPSTYMSTRTYPHKSKNCDYESPNQIAASRQAYDQTKYHPQTGHYGQSIEDGGGQYWQRSRLYHDHNGTQQQREYYNQYEMTDSGGNKAGYRHTKQDTAFYY